MNLQEWGNTEWVYPHIANFGPEGKWQANGMALRDYFAAKAMQGLSADPSVDGSCGQIALMAYEMADAMLAAREAK